MAVLRECEAIADPREAFEACLYRICELQANDRGMRQVISATHGIDKVAAFHERGGPQFERLFNRAKQAGAFRPECEASDLVVAFWMIGKVSDATSRNSPAVAPPARLPARRAARGSGAAPAADRAVAVDAADRDHHGDRLTR